LHIPALVISKAECLELMLCKVIMYLLYKRVYNVSAKIDAKQ